MKIAVTLGDPAGIGPEIVAKALRHFERPQDKFMLVGNRNAFDAVSRNLQGVLSTAGNVEFMDVPGGAVKAGVVQKEAGLIAMRSIEKAVELAKHGRVEGICTAPINKESLMLAGSPDIDHTGMLSRLTGTRDSVTLFQTGKLRIIFATKHMSLKNAIDSINEELVSEYIRRSDRALSLLGVQRKIIAVAAVNPHGGEGGLMGREEIDFLSPAITKCKEEFNVEGPFPADSVFHRAAKGEFDVVLSMYHDQGHIAAKMLDFDGTVSMNIGLPFLRTSVDHGTAFDIAGMGIARETNMVRALETCLQLSSIYSRNLRRIESNASPFS